jgi:hypothetical protein
VPSGKLSSFKEALLATNLYVSTNLWIALEPLSLDYHSFNFISLDWIGPINYNNALAWLCGYTTSDKSFTVFTAHSWSSFCFLK